MKLMDLTSALETSGGNILVTLLLIVFFGGLCGGLVIYGSHIPENSAAWLASGAIINAVGMLVGAVVMGMKGHQKDVPGSTAVSSVTPTPPPPPTAS